MRIAFVMDVERSTLDLANQLSRMGHEAIVIAPAERLSEPASSYAYDGAWVRTVEAAEVDQLASVLREESSEIAHVMDPMRLPQALDAAEQLGLPVVAHVIDLDLYDAAAKALLARAAAVVSPIERHAEDGFDTTAWHHVPSGTDVPPSLEEEAWMVEGIYIDCLVNAASA
jgi:Glycosyltransferase Family 4